MTATIATMFPIERPSPWTMLFAEDSDKDLDFDEGFEEDELHQSKPPSRRPLVWILLLVLVSAVAYWALNNQSSQSPRTAAIESFEDTTAASEEEDQIEILPPLFSENQTVTLISEGGEGMLMGDPNNSQPGPLVRTNESLTILDGTQQLHGWVYLVKTPSGKTGWVSEEKLK